MTKIERVNYLPSSALACYDPIADTIFYNSAFDKYPALKRRILWHERMHQKHKYNIFVHIILDVKDAFELRFGKHKKEYAKLIKEVFYAHSDWRRELVIAIYTVFYILFLPVISFLDIIFFIQQKMIGEK